MRIEKIPQSDHRYTTLGYWYFTERNNKGELVIQVTKLSDWKYEWAVIGHECVEAVYCWIMGITTQECDRFDDICEAEFAAGFRNVLEEPGFDKNCPYRIGHILGVAWEYIWIHLSLASWKQYCLECDNLIATRCTS